MPDVRGKRNPKTQRNILPTKLYYPKKKILEMR